MHADASCASNRLLGSGAEQGRLHGGLGGRLRRTRWKFTVLTGQFPPPAAVEGVKALAMTSAAHGLQQGPASAGRSHLRHLPFAMTLSPCMSVRPVGSINWRGARRPERSATMPEDRSGGKSKGSLAVSSQRLRRWETWAEGDGPVEIPGIML